jgi:hypothetical protein
LESRCNGLTAKVNRLSMNCTEIFENDTQNGTAILGVSDTRTVERLPYFDRFSIPYIRRATTLRIGSLLVANIIYGALVVRARRGTAWYQEASRVFSTNQDKYRSLRSSASTSHRLITVSAPTKVRRQKTPPPVDKNRWQAVTMPISRPPMSDSASSYLRCPFITLTD